MVLVQIKVILLVFYWRNSDFNFQLSRREVWLVGILRKEFRKLRKLKIVELWKYFFGKKVLWVLEEFLGVQKIVYNKI